MHLEELDSTLKPTVSGSDIGFLDDGFKIKRKSKSDVNEASMKLEHTESQGNLLEDPSVTYLKAADLNVTKVGVDDSDA